MDRAIAVATRLFHQRGYDSVGIAELSKQIGITPPSLYSAFGNKRSLFETVLERYVQQNSGWLVAALASSETLETCIQTLFERAAETYTSSSECRGCLALDGSRNCGDEGAKELTAGYRRKTWELIRDRIAAESSATELDEAESVALSDAAVDTLSDYTLTILLGLSASARDGVTTAALKETGAIAAAGFTQRLRDCRGHKPKA